MQLEGACPRGRGQEREKESGESGISFLFRIMPRKSWRTCALKLYSTTFRFIDIQFGP